MKFVIANWKMNGDFELVNQMMSEIGKGRECCKVIVCPPTALITSFKGFEHYLGAQNCFYEEKGAFTGENSPKLLKDIGCKYVILGHSERRAIFQESDELVFKKWNAAIRFGLTPIICIGETLEERSRWKEVLAAQLANYCADKSLDLQGTIFAYEPVWSIGTGKVPSMQEIEDAIGFIKGVIGAERNYYVVYGGSVNGSNSAGILNIHGLDGVLVGSASLKVSDFKTIIGNASV